MLLGPNIEDYKLALSVLQRQAVKLLLLGAFRDRRILLELLLLSSFPRRCRPERLPQDHISLLGLAEGERMGLIRSLHLHKDFSIAL